MSYEPITNFAREVLQERLAAAQENARTAQARADAQLRRAEHDLADFEDHGLRAAMFSVSIFDPWDAASSSRASQGSNTAKGRTLMEAMATAQNHYRERVGQIRDDGVLRYHVVMEIDADTSVEVPESVWLPLAEISANARASA